MKGIDETKALSVLFANTRRKKRKADLVTIAECCQYLAELYGSPGKVAEKVGLSNEMVREFLLVLKLPKEVLEMIRKRRIDSIDSVKVISSIKSQKMQITAAREMVDLKSKDVRDVVRVSKVSGKSIAEAKRTILNTDSQGTHIFVMDFDDETYSAIQELSRKAGKKAADFVSDLVKEKIKTLGSGKR